MRISDWSSDVCSSDLGGGVGAKREPLDDEPVRAVAGGKAADHGTAWIFAVQPRLGHQHVGRAVKIEDVQPPVAIRPLGLRIGKQQGVGARARRPAIVYRAPAGAKARPSREPQNGKASGRESGWPEV